jgi:hypothetical protein
MAEPYSNDSWADIFGRKLAKLKELSVQPFDVSFCGMAGV